MISFKTIMLPKKTILTALFLMNVVFSLAQSNNSTKVMQELSADFDTLSLQYPSEKMYVHFDKPDYVTRDTIWFKVYLFNAANLQGSLLSGVMYVEIANEDDTVVKRMALPVVGGLSWGDIPLDTTFKPGTYTFRAYTRWMLNFSRDYIFTKQIKIAANLNGPWIAQMAFDHHADQVKVNLRLTNVQQQPLSDQAVELSLVNDKKKLHTNVFTTNENGELEFNFTPSDRKSDNLSLWIGGRDAAKPKIIIPLMLHRPQKIDLQFMQEGGNSIPGWPVRMGFKAIGEDGKGVKVSGAITNSKGDTVAHFQTLHKGMGSCLLMPESGEKYTAHIAQPKGNQTPYPLPPVEQSGTLLQVNNMSDADSLMIQIAATPDIARSRQPFLLIGQANGQLLYETIIKIPARGMALHVSRSLFPHGVVKFSLLDMEYRPLNERLVFIDHPDELQLAIKENKKQYHPHDSIALQIQAVNKEGDPVPGSFSIAVTDDSQVKANSGNIVDYLYLSSYLKGYIEDPGYYLNKDSFPAEAMDNLLLTQGWVGYDWSTITHPSKPPQYQPEPQFTVQGKILSRLFGKPVKGARVLLVSGKPPFIKDTVTGKDGTFTFTNFPPLDTVAFSIQAYNKRDKPYNGGIEVKEFKPPHLPPDTFPATLPWNVNTDSTLLQYAVDNAVHQNEQEELLMKGQRLREVVVKAKKIVPGSQNLNGPGNADVVINADDLINAGRTSVLDLLKKYVKGIRINYTGSRKGIYYLNNRISIVIDGAGLWSVYQPIGDQIDVLKFLDAQDIKGIEIMHSPQYTYKYNVQFDRINPEMNNYIYIEITTRAGNFLFSSSKPGVYVYRPIPFSWPKKFYSPKYAVKQDSISRKDLRSTIYWNPDVETDSTGHTTLNFYAADRPSTYTVIIQGSDMKGHVGYLKKEIVVK